MKDRDAELKHELKAHLDMAIAERVARGESPEQASAAARRQLGNLSQIQEATRDVWGRRWLAHLAQDVRYAVRVFRRNPGFALVAILSLTFGIGANTALFEVVDAVRLRPLPIADPGNLLEVRLASLDGLTRIANRGAFDERRRNAQSDVHARKLARGTRDRAHLIQVRRKPVHLPVAGDEFPWRHLFPLPYSKRP